jgi:hypothetical protein
MPEAVAMPRSIPHQLGSEAELLDELMQRVHAVEVEVAAERHRTRSAGVRAAHAAHAADAATC